MAIASLAAGAAAQPAPDITLPLFQSALTFPVGVLNAGDGSNRLFILQQQGRVLIRNGTQLLATPFLNVLTLLPAACQADPTKCGESGLLGLTFHPDYASNGYFFIYYTAVNGDNTVARYKVSSNANVADPSSATILLKVPDPYVNHNGGQVAFGPDGFLYIGMGDGGSGGDPQFRAQNLGVLLGKILRIDVDGTGAVPCGQQDPAPYGIPSTNPFASSSTACPEIWAFGMRNPWRFGFDRAGGDLYIGDVGEGKSEEIDFEPAGGGGGVNYGWNRMEGFHCYNPAANCNDGSLTLPILEHDHSQGCSVTGGFVYRGSLSPQLYGVYLYGDYCSGRIWGATRDGAGNWSKRQVATSQYISSFGEDEAGELYLVEHSGSVRRIVGPTGYAVPAISSLTPSAAIQGDPSFPLAVNGAGFTPASVVRWNGSGRPTTYVSRTRLTVSISASDVAAAGSASLTVFNPAPGGGTSPGRVFSIANLFVDVPLTHPLRRPIEGISEAEITSGCGGRMFCPESPVTRDQMAILLLRAAHGVPYDPPAASGTVFADVQKADFAAAFIEQLAAEGITSGCGAGIYCPTTAVTRAPIAKFLLKGLDGGAYLPSTPAAGVFSDVSPTAPFAIWIEELSRRGFTSGCGSGKYCPNQVVTRAQMAAFLARTFGIALPP
jgi:glucose/arabinose dehydrogenase